MLEHLGHPQAAAAIIDAIEVVLADPSSRTGDLGGTANTITCGRAVAEALSSSDSNASRASGVQNCRSLP